MAGLHHGALAGPDVKGAGPPPAFEPMQLVDVDRGSMRPVIHAR
jgi:hypothetical protein